LDDGSLFAAHSPLHNLAGRKKHPEVGVGTPTEAQRQKNCNLSCDTKIEFAFCVCNHIFSLAGRNQLKLKHHSKQVGCNTVDGKNLDQLVWIVQTI